MHDPPWSRGPAGGSFPSVTAPAAVRTVPLWGRPGPLHVPVRSLTADGGFSFPPLSAPRAGRIAHLATQKPDQDGSPAARERFSREMDENGRTDRPDNSAVLRRLCKLGRQRDLVGRQCSHPIRRTAILVPSSVLLLIMHVIVYNVTEQTNTLSTFCVFHPSF